VLTAHLDRPFAIALTPRQLGFGYLRNTYYGYVLNRRGTVAVFESGPDGSNGWGYDDIIGMARYIFHRPKAVQVDPGELRSGVWIAHEGKIDVATGSSSPPGTGAVTRLYLVAAIFGQLPIQSGSQPHFRGMRPVVDVSLGVETVTGIPVDLACDDLRNLGALAGLATGFSAGQPIEVNSKSLVRDFGGPVAPSNFPRYLFLAIPDSGPTMSGAIDVIDVSGHYLVDTNAYHPGAQSIPAPGVSCLMDYFRQ
jgi:hypothetical protein